VIVLSGIAPTNRGGTGRLLLGLIEEQRSKNLDVQFVFVGNRANVARSLLLRNPVGLGQEVVRHYWRRASRNWLLRTREFVETPRLVVLHPQEIGTRWLDALITRRARLSKITELFVLDASFFCVRSYNHMPGENAPCLRCLHHGPSEGARHGCRAFPIRDPWASTFVSRMRQHALRGSVAFWAQTEGYRTLLTEFAGQGAKVRVAGLWTDDFDDLENSFPMVPPIADIVYHGSWHEAKGAQWALSLAAAMPDRTFLFPCRKPAATEPPPNALFRNLSWDTGLAEQVQASPLCLVPSLWTATIEGALVKSIAHAPATAVVASSFAFSEELPDGLVLRLPADIGDAATMLRTRAGWQPSAALRTEWLKSFASRNTGILETLAHTAFEG
jgi:hypothetical protein